MSVLPFQISRLCLCTYSNCLCKFSGGWLAYFSRQISFEQMIRHLVEFLLQLHPVFASEFRGVLCSWISANSSDVKA